MSSSEFKEKFNHRFFSPYLKNNNNFIDDLDDPLEIGLIYLWWKKHRNQISKNKNSIETHLIKLPDDKE